MLVGNILINFYFYASSWTLTNVYLALPDQMPTGMKWINSLSSYLKVPITSKFLFFYLILYCNEPLRNKRVIRIKSNFL